MPGVDGSLARTLRSKVGVVRFSQTAYEACLAGGSRIGARGRSGGKNRREIYGRMPSLPRVTPRRTSGSGDTWVLEASLDYGDGEPYMAVFIFQMREGRIAQEIAYWSRPFPAPEWRMPWIETITPPSP